MAPLNYVECPFYFHDYCVLNIFDYKIDLTGVKIHSIVNQFKLKQATNDNKISVKVENASYCSFLRYSVALAIAFSIPAGFLPPAVARNG